MRLDNSDVRELLTDEITVYLEDCIEQCLEPDAADLAANVIAYLQAMIDDDFMVESDDDVDYDYDEYAEEAGVDDGESDV